MSLTLTAQEMLLKPPPSMWMTVWYEPWFGEMDWTVGVEQADTVKETPLDDSLVGRQRGEATHSGVDLVTRSEPEEDEAKCIKSHLYV